MMTRELGADSFVAGIVASVEADPDIPTACIDAEGYMKYNPKFVSQHVKTEQDLFCLVFHEILHPAFGHFVHKSDQISIIACDAIINALHSHSSPSQVTICIALIHRGLFKRPKPNFPPNSGRRMDKKKGPASRKSFE